MVAELISIGDELLIGQTVNTNASWLGKELSLIGIRVKWVSTISDVKEDIIQTVDNALKRSSLVIITGGLGPTKDDITKYTLAEYFNSKLILNNNVLERIEAYFTARGREMLEVNRLQAMLPEACEVIENHYGTASGMWFEKNDSVLISLPGVPYEMKGLMQDVILSKLINHFQTSALYHKTMLTTGIGESYLAEYISDWEDKVRGLGLGLAYLPSPGLVKLRLSSYKGIVEAQLIDELFDELEVKLFDYAFGYENDTLSGNVGLLLKEHQLTVSTVESCTGGGVGNAIVNTPGSSAYFLGGVITYSYELKSLLANVSPKTLLTYGAVSEQTVIEMAKGGRSKIGSDYCISISGVAGPDGGTPDKPVGTVWMAIDCEEGCFTKKINLGDNRERNIQMTIFASLNMLRLLLLKKK